MKIDFKTFAPKEHPEAPGRSREIARLDELFEARTPQQAARDAKRP